MAALTQGERLVAVETRLSDIERTLNKIDGKIDALAPTYVTQTQLTDKITALETELTEVKGKMVLTKTLVPIISAVAASVVTFLLIEFLQQSKGA